MRSLTHRWSRSGCCGASHCSPRSLGRLSKVSPGRPDRSPSRPGRRSYARGTSATSTTPSSTVTLTSPWAAGMSARWGWRGLRRDRLLADVPRTATVVARHEGSLLELDRGPFLTVVTGHDASRRAAWSVARRLAPRTRPRGASRSAGTTPRRPRHRCGQVTKPAPPTHQYRSGASLSRRRVVVRCARRAWLQSPGLVGSTREALPNRSARESKHRGASGRRVPSSRRLPTVRARFPDAVIGVRRRRSCRRLSRASRVCPVVASRSARQLWWSVVSPHFPPVAWVRRMRSPAVSTSWAMSALVDGASRSFRQDRGSRGWRRCGRRR